MRKFKFEKLVRDKIVETIASHGDKPSWYVLNNEEFIIELKKKLLEEATEIQNASQEEMLHELADITEIIETLRKSYKISVAQLRQAQKSKEQKAGGFRKKQYIKYIAVGDNQEQINYFLSQPDKYPEIKD